jgi:hypothetical protein
MKRTLAARLAAFVAALFAAFFAAFFASPGVALACPQCAGRDDAGVAQGVILGLFILLPFAVVGVVYRYIRSEATLSGDGHVLNDGAAGGPKPRFYDGAASGPKPRRA